MCVNPAGCERTVGANIVPMNSIILQYVIDADGLPEIGGCDDLRMELEPSTRSLGPAMCSSTSHRARRRWLSVRFDTR